MKNMLLSTLLFLSGQAVGQEGSGYEVFHGPTGLYGMLSPNGDTLFQPEYRSIYRYHGRPELVLAAAGARTPRHDMPYFVVGNQNGEQAVFDTTGQKILDFQSCFRIEMEFYTNTIIRKWIDDKNHMHSEFYDLTRARQDTVQYRDIGYVHGSRMLALELKKDVVYLFHAESGEKRGPFININHWGQDSCLTLNDERGWGMLDLNGNVLLDFNYKSIKKVDKENLKRVEEQHRKPVGVRFFAEGFKKDGLHVYFDRELNVYEPIHEENIGYVYRKVVKE
jgi:hypothetical protein